MPYLDTNTPYISPNNLKLVLCTKPHIRERFSLFTGQRSWARKNYLQNKMSKGLPTIFKWVRLSLR